MPATSKQSAQIVFCAWLAFLCSFVDRLSWPPIIPLAIGDLKLTATEAGSFMSIFFLGYLLTQIPGGMLADRFGIRRVLLGSLFLVATFTVAFAWTPNYAAGIFLRFLAGLGSGAILAAAVKGVYDCYRPARRATALGFFMTSLPAGLMLANLSSPWIAGHFGWRASFGAAGALTFLAMGFTAWLLPASSPSTVSGNWQSGKQLKELMKNRSLLITAAAGFCAMWATWGALTWNNSYLHQELHLSLAESGKVTVLFATGALVGQPLAGLVADRFPAGRRQVSMLILLGFALLLCFYGQNRNPQLLTVLSPLLGAAAFVFGPVLNTFISELVQKDQVGTAIGFCNAVWQIGSLISPVLAGLVLDVTGSYGGVFLMLAAGPALAVLLLSGVKTAAGA